MIKNTLAMIGAAHPLLKASQFVALLIIKAAVQQNPDLKQKLREQVERKHGGAQTYTINVHSNFLTREFLHTIDAI